MLEKYDKNNNPFKVPENYFEDLTQNVMSTLPEENKKQVKKIRLWRRVLSWSAVAAVLLAIILSVSVFDLLPLEHSQNSTQDDNMIKNTQEYLVQNDIQDYILFLEEEAQEADYVDMLFDE